MEPTIIKRLHISGLTPSISQQDLYQRLSTFGNVKSLDGLGLLDGVGQPKKFAYATLEATPTKLARCLNTLSGSTWKGAKLRIGAAKPDFGERLEAENEKHAAEAEAPRKKRLWKYVPYQARHSKDMTPVTLETAKLKGGWVVTPLGRVYRPMRMRPPRPLPPLSSTRSHTVKKDPQGNQAVKERKRIRKPDSRARRRRIDMVKYGSEYLKGRFLEVDVPLGRDGIVPSMALSMQLVQGGDGEESDEEHTDDGGEQSSEEEEEGAEKGQDQDEVLTGVVSNVQFVVPSLTLPQPKTMSSASSTMPTAPSHGINLHQEMKQSLNVLTSLFGNLTGVEGEGADNWIGKESLDSDIDEANLAQVPPHALDSQSMADDFEIVPRDGLQGKSQPLKSAAVMIEKVDVEMAELETQHQEHELSKKEQPASNESKKAPSASTKLKDLFAPTEAEEGGFSLLGHLNLDVDLELDEDVPFPTTQNVNNSTTENLVEEQTISVPATSAAGVRTDSRQARQVSQITLDPSQPLLFPLTLLATHPAAAGSSIFANPSAKNRPMDMYDTFKENGWDWPSSGFYRTQTEDEIRQRWEEQKGELTQGWKKKWREAAKLRRRRGTVAGEEN